MSHPRGHVPRTRLHARLDEATRARLTVVSADAGFGKTSLLHDWTPAGSVARPATRDVPGIAAALVAVLRQHDPAAAARLAPVAESGADEERALALAGLLCTALSDTEVLLVVDDAHLMSPATGRFVQSLVRQAPPGLRALLTTRTTVPFPTDRLDTVHVTGTELAFDDDELSALLVDLLGDDALAGQLDAMLGRWPAALRLAAESLSAHPAAERPDQLQRMRREGGSDLVALATEVMAQEPEATRRLAQLVAPYDAFTPDLAVALGADASAVEQLVGRGILTDVGEGWLAFPRLMREFLRFSTPLAPDERRATVRRAQLWFEEHDHPEGALRCALDAPDVDEVTRLLLAHGRRLLDGGRAGRVAQALRVAGNDRPELAGVRGALLESLGDADAARVAYESVTDPEPWVACRLGVLRYQRGELEAALRALDVPLDDSADSVRALAWRATVHWARGEPDAAGEAGRQALALGEQVGDDGALAAVHVALALVAAHRGDRQANREHYERALVHATAAGDVEQVVRIHNNLGSRLLEEGELHNALEQLEQAIELAEAGGLRFYLSLALANRGELRFHLGQLDAAAADLEAARALDTEMGSPSASSALVHLGHVYRHRACTTLSRQAYEEAAAAARASGDVNLLVPALGGLAQLLADNDPATAKELADEVLSYDAGLGRVGALCAAAWVALARGDRAAALAHATEALAEAEPRRDRLGQAEALHVAAIADPTPDDPRLERAAGLLEEVGAPVWLAKVRMTQATRQPGGHLLLDEIAEQASDLGGRLVADMALAAARRLDAEHPSAAVEVVVLGGFRVRRKGVEVGRLDWPSLHARALLERLVCRPSWPRQQLARSLRDELLLDTALDELRSVLDPDDALPVGHYVVDDGAVVRLQNVVTDVAEFLSEAASGLRRGDAALLRRAEARYAGDVLEDRPGEAWADTLREEARGRYVEVARALVRLSAPEAAARYSRRILERDPYDESAHLSLIGALRSLGREVEARRCWSTYAQRLDELGLEALPFGSDAAAEGVAAGG